MTVSKTCRWRSGMPSSLRRAARSRGVAVDPPGDPGQPVRPVVGGVQPGDHGQQHLGGADVARRPLPADVLLTCLQGQPVGGATRGVDRDADQSSGHLALQAGADRHHPGVRAPEAHRDAEALGRAHHDVRTELSGRREQAQREQVGGHDQAGPGAVHALGQRCEVGRIVDQARGRRRADEHAEVPGVGQAGQHVAHVEGDPQRLGTGGQHGQCLRVGVGVDDEGGGPRTVDPVQQRHRLGGCRGLVEHGGIRDGQAGEVADHGLEVQQRLEPALRDLGLVGRVGRVPARRLQDVAPDHRRGQGVLVAQADHRDGPGVGPGDTTQLGGHLVLTEGRGQVESLRPGDGGRHRRARQGVQVGLADHLEHVRHVLGRGPDVALDELREVCGLDLHGRNPSGPHRPGPVR